MNAEEVAAVIELALPLRPPRFEPETAPRVKVTAIEDYMLESAYTHAELEEAHHWLSKVVEQCADEIAEITGYEACLPSKPRDRITRDDIIAAKRIVRQEPFLAGAEAKRLRATVLRQVARFEYEQTTLSRVYSLISGS